MPKACRMKAPRYSMADMKLNFRYSRVNEIDFRKNPHPCPSRPHTIARGKGECKAFTLSLNPLGGKLFQDRGHDLLDEVFGHFFGGGGVQAGLAGAHA